MNNNQMYTDDFKKSLDHLIHLAADNHINPFEAIEWPESLPDDQFWMSPDLLSLHGTPYEEHFQGKLIALSKWESINFYSLNVHGIRELLLEVVKRIHMPGFEEPSEFFHRFIAEENEHMWFFAKFCINYGGKRGIYPDRQVKFDISENNGNQPNYDPVLETDIETFLVFLRIMIFEEIVDYFNRKMAGDEILHPLIRHINQIHHDDESRHIAFGRKMVSLLYQTKLKERLEKNPLRLSSLRTYIEDYIKRTVGLLYNPTVYRDAGIPIDFREREKLIAYPARTAYHEQHFLGNTHRFLLTQGIFSERVEHEN